MRNIKYFLLLILFAACNKPAPRSNEIVKIDFARLGGLQSKQVSLSIDSSLTYNYYGFPGNKKTGYYSGKISQAYWDTINQKFEKIKYKTLITPKAELSIYNGAVYELVITWKNGKKVFSTTENESDSVLSVLNWLSESYKKVELRPRKTPLKFETSNYFPPPIPKQIKDKPIKFPPPNKN